MNISYVSGGFRSSAFLTESRRILWCGSNGDIEKQAQPAEFVYKPKLPELFSYDNHHIVKIHHSWSRTMSVFYAVIAESGPLHTKLKNPQKLNSILSMLSNKWVSKSIFPPRLEHLENYVANKHKQKAFLKYK